MTMTMTGGCQCGRVRYAAAIASGEAYLCHCRMCQRATGGVAAAFVNLPRDAVAWQGLPEWFASSPIAKRAFCPTCGTPLSFAFNDSPNMDLTVGSFDDAGHFRPVAHFGVEGMHGAWLDTTSLPQRRSDETESVIARWRAAGLEVPR